MERNSRKEIIGLVASNKMQKSVTVTIERKKKHAKYHKFVKPLQNLWLTMKKKSVE